MVADSVERGDKGGPVVTRADLLARLELAAENAGPDVSCTGRSAADVPLLSGPLAPGSTAREHLNP